MGNLSDIILFAEGVLTSPIHEICEYAFGKTSATDEVVRAAILWAAGTYSEEDFVATTSEQLSLGRNEAIAKLVAAVQPRQEVLDYFESLSRVFRLHVSPDLPPPLFDKLHSERKEFFGGVIRSIVNVAEEDPPGGRETTLLVAWNPKLIYRWNEIGWDVAVFPDLFRFNRELNLRGYAL